MAGRDGIRHRQMAQKPLEALKDLERKSCVLSDLLPAEGIEE